MRKHTDEFLQFAEPVTCREYILPLDDKLTDRKGWISRKHQNWTRVGSHNLPPYKVNLEWTSELNLWTRTILTRGSESLMDWTSWSQTWTTTSRKPQTRSSNTMRWNRIHVLLQADQEAQAKPQRRISASSSTKIYLLEKELGPILNHKIIRSKIIQCRRNWLIFFVMVVYSEKMMERLNSGDSKDHLQDHFVHSRHWSDEKWKSIMTRGGQQKRFQYCADSWGEFLYLRALQGHSGRNLIDPSLQDIVLIPDDFFKYIYHIGCAINSHSIINSRLIPGGQNLSKRQTVFFLLVNPVD